MKIFYIVFICFISLALSLKAELEVISPNGGEQIHIESGHLIEWTGCEANDTLMIHYSTNNGRDWKFITDEATNFQYLWEDIPLLESDNCLLRLTHSQENNIEINAPEIEWEKNYGGTSTDLLRDATLTKDGDILLCGFSTSNDIDIDTNKGVTDFLILKIDEDGNKIWSKTYGGSYYDEAGRVLELSDKNIIVTGRGTSLDGDVNRNEDDGLHWTIKLNSDGELTNYSLLSLSKQVAHGLIEINNNIFMVGDKERGKLPYIGNPFLSKYDQNFNKKFDTLYHGNINVRFNEIIKVETSNFIIGGVKNRKLYGYVSGIDTVDSKILILKADTLGNIIWSKEYGGSFGEETYEINKSYDGNYYVCGRTFSDDGDIPNNAGWNDAYVMKIDKSGDLLWIKTLGTNLNDWFSSLLPTPDGGVICCGNLNVDTINRFSNQYSDMVVARYAKNGDLMWQKVIGGSAGDNCSKILPSKDNGFYIVGSTYSHDGDISNNYGYYDGWVVKLKSDASYTYTSTQSDNYFELYSTKPIAAYDIDSFDDLICESIDEIELEIYNVGEYDMSLDSAMITGPDKDDFSLINFNENDIILPGECQTVSVLFNPESSGEKSATLRIYNNSKNKPVINIPFNVRKDTSIIEFSTDKIIFDKLERFAADTQSVEIINKGTIPYKFDLPVTLNNFKIDSLKPNPLPSGDTATVNVYFLGDEGGDYSEEYSTTDTCNNIHTLTLEANVKHKGEIEYNLNDFENLLCEDQTEVLLKVENTGESTIIIDSTKIMGIDKNVFSLVNSIDENYILAGYYLDINVIFNPTTSGVKNAELVIYSNAGNEPELHIPLQAKKDSVGFTFEENPVVFDNLNPDTPDTKIIEITNTGTVDVEFNLPQTINNFEIRNITPNPVPAGEAAQLEVYFSGDAAGNYNEEYIYRDICNIEHILELEAYVNDNSSDLVIYFSDFKNLVCEYTNTKELSVKNLSDTDIEIYSANIYGTNKDEFILEDDLSNETIAAGEELITSVTFKPQSTGTKTAYLLLENSSTETPELRHDFDAKKDSVSLTYSTDRVEFLGLEEYETASEIIEIINTGSVTVTLPDKFSYNEFEIRNISPNPIMPDETAEAEVFFSGAAGGEYEETAIIPDICLRTFEIALYAQVNENSGGKKVKYSKKSEFQDILCDNTTQSEIEISNTGDEDLLIEEVYVSGDDAASFILDENYDEQTLKQGEKLTVNITYTPEKTGTANAILNIKNNSENSPEMEIPLKARKDSSSLLLSETEIHFNNLTIDEEDTQIITITNTGTVEISIAQPYELNEFILSNISPNPIPAGSEAQAEIKFTGGNAGDYSETFELLDLCGRKYNIIASASVKNTDPPLITLKVMDASGAADEIITVFGEFEDNDNIELEKMNISGNLYFDHNLLGATDKPMTKVDANTSFIHLSDIDAHKDMQFPLADFKVMESDNSECKLELRDVETDEQVKINSKPGTFTLLTSEGKSRITVVNPNPTLDEVAISFYTGESGNVELKMVNSIGQYIRTIYQGENTKGSNHNLTISTSKLASGVYYLILNAPDGTVTKKIVILE